MWRSFPAEGTVKASGACLAGVRKSRAWGMEGELGRVDGVARWEWAGKNQSVVWGTIGRSGGYSSQRFWAGQWHYPAFNLTRCLQGSARDGRYFPQAMRSLMQFLHTAVVAQGKLMSVTVFQSNFIYQPRWQARFGPCWSLDCSNNPEEGWGWIGPGLWQWRRREGVRCWLYFEGRAHRICCQTRYGVWEKSRKPRKETKDDSKVFGLRNWRNGVTTGDMGKTKRGDLLGEWGAIRSQFGTWTLKMSSR